VRSILDDRVDFFYSFLLLADHDEAKSNVEVCFMAIERAQAHIRKVRLTAVLGEDGSACLRLVEDVHGLTLLGLIYSFLFIFILDGLALFKVQNGFFVFFGVEVDHRPEKVEVLSLEDIFIVVTEERDILQLIQVHSLVEVYTHGSHLLLVTLLAEELLSDDNLLNLYPPHIRNDLDVQWTVLFPHLAHYPRLIG